MVVDMGKIFKGIRDVLWIFGFEGHFSFLPQFPRRNWRQILRFSEVEQKAGLFVTAIQKNSPGFAIFSFDLHGNWRQFGKNQGRKG